MNPLPVHNLHVTLEDRPTSDPMAPTGERELVLKVYAKDLPHVDRKNQTISAWIFSLTHKKLAERLRDAILHGKVFKGYDIKVDVNGQTYYSAERTSLAFYGRHMNKALREVGF